MPDAPPPVAPVRLIDDWWMVLRHSWSVRLGAISVLIIVLEPVVTALVALYTGPSIWITVTLNVLAGLVALAGIAARVVCQDKIETVYKPGTEQ